MKLSMLSGKKTQRMIPMKNNKEFVDYVYDIVRLDCAGLDSIYKDYILQMVGVYGFNALLEHKLLESCGVINGRRLFVLCEKGSQ
jgi:hypothetical protein